MSNVSEGIAPEHIDRVHKLVHPVSTLIVGVVETLFFLAITIISNVFRNPTTTIWTTLEFLAFALLGAVIIDAYLRDRHEVSEDGMSYARLFGGRDNLKWPDVISVRYSRYCQWFVVRTKDGQVARIHLMLRGISDFCRLVLSHVPRTAIDSSALSSLQAVVTGDTRPLT